MKLNQLVYLVAGGDQRQVHLADLLSLTNTVYTVGFADDVAFSARARRLRDPAQLPRPVDVAVLPVPAAADSQTVHTPLDSRPLLLEQVLKSTAGSGLVLGGMISPALGRECDTYGLRWVDYMQREELAVLNAVPTALSKAG